MTISHWYHMNTYVSLAVIFTMLAAAIIFSMQRARRVEAAATAVPTDRHTLL